MRIAVIGSGISGMTAAYLLHRDHQITVFEANDYIGGHTHTVDVSPGGKTYPVDTGFIVFNERTYPNFVRLLRRLGVPWQKSNMSFSVHCERTELEYCPSSLDRLFAQRRNLLRPGFWRMVREVFAYRRQLPQIAELPVTVTLGDYLRGEGYSRMFREYFIIPMGAAIWSAAPRRFEAMPACMFARFFANHGFLNVRDQPQWLVIQGGSQEYARVLTAPFRDRIRLDCPVRSIRRLPDSVEVEAADGRPERFDHLIVATHSDQALRLLADPTENEREILGAISYQENQVVLHTDESVLPRRRKVWASWNYRIPRETREGASVTYDMNILQGLDAAWEFCVTLNPTERIDPEKVLRHMAYAHPVFNPQALAAQRRHAEISGVNRTHYCGAYWANGFHEDGVNSALTVCGYFGKDLSDA
ncbi:MAG: FAD-dependent oxidoreductase [Planctomycetes bacterium]|jgi:predicted NAD/FAD-binding protein|nr:FAD-dependent oxidoreductase [Planctomycetota bacterium]